MTDVITVYGEHLWDGKKAGVVKAQGNMGGLVVRAVVTADALSTTEITMHIKAGDNAKEIATEIGKLKINAIGSPVEKNQILGEVMLPWNVAKYVTADVKGAGDSGAPDANIKVTLGYLPR